MKNSIPNFTAAARSEAASPAVGNNRGEQPRLHLRRQRAEKRRSQHDAAEHLAQNGRLPQQPHDRPAQKRAREHDR
jgi:hypothetical protein